MYIGNDLLTDQKPVAGQQVVSLGKKASRRLQEKQHDDGNLQKQVHKTLASFSKPHRKRHKKNRKNKGIRLKHRRKNAGK